MKRIIILFMICFVCVSSSFAGMAEDMQSRFDFGIQAMKSGDYDVAIYNFQEMLAENPNLPRVRLELARAYSLSGKRMFATREFKSVLDSNPPEQVRENIERYLSSIGGLPRWDFDVSVGYMYDDNVTAGTDDDVVYFYGLPFVLDESAKKQADSAMLISVNVSHVSPISDSVSWVSYFNFNSTDYFSLNKFDFQMLRGSTGPSWKKGKTIWRVPVVWDYAFLGSDRYSAGIGIRPGFSTYLATDLIVSGSVLLERKQHYFRRDRTGYLSGFDLSVRKILSKDFSVSAGYQFWMEDAKLAVLSNDTDVLYMALSKKLKEDLTVRVASVFSWSDYDKGSPAFGNKVREDFRKRVSISLQKNISKRTDLLVEYCRTMNDSNLNLYEFDRNQISVSLRFTF